MKIKINYKAIIKGLAVSLLIIILIASIGYGFNSNYKDIWAGIVVIQFGVAFIFLIIKLGTFSISSHGARRLGNSLRSRKNKKLGYYNDEKSKKNLKSKKFNENKSKQAIYIMIIIGIIEFFSTL